MLDNTYIYSNLAVSFATRSEEHYYIDSRHGYVKDSSQNDSTYGVCDATTGYFDDKSLAKFIAKIALPHCLVQFVSERIVSFDGTARCPVWKPVPN